MIVATNAFTAGGLGAAGLMRQTFDTKFLSTSLNFNLTRFFSSSVYTTIQNQLLGVFSNESTFINVAPRCSNAVCKSKEENTPGPVNSTNEAERRAETNLINDYAGFKTLTNSANIISVIVKKLFSTPAPRSCKTTKKTQRYRAQNKAINLKRVIQVRPQRKTESIQTPKPQDESRTKTLTPPKAIALSATRLVGNNNIAPTVPTAAAELSPVYISPPSLPSLKGKLSIDIPKMRLPRSPRGSSSTLPVILKGDSESIQLHKRFLSAATPSVACLSTQAATPQRNAVSTLIQVVPTNVSAPKEKSAVPVKKDPSVKVQEHGGMAMNRPRGTSEPGVRDIFAVKGTPTEIDSPAIAVEKTRGGVTVRAHFIRHEGKYVFAGWEEVGASTAQNQHAITPALWAPAPMREERPLTRGFGTPGGGVPGGESALEERLPSEEAVIEETFVSLILEQLRSGPQSLDSDQLWESFNSFLFTSRYAPIFGFVTKEEWNTHLRNALTTAIRYTPVIDENGMRSLDEIQRDASTILGINTDTLAQWEDHLDLDSIAKHLAPEGTRGSGQLSNALDRQIGIRASSLFPVGNRDTAIGMDQETEMQWAVARIGLTSSTDAQVSATQKLVTLVASLLKQNMHAAARFLALVVKHSEINELGIREDSLLAPWSEGDIKSLMSRLMNSETWGIVSHRSFRQHLTPQENKQINKFVYSANYENAVEMLKEVDVFEISDEKFWELVDATGHGDTLMEDAMYRMVSAARG